MESFGTGQLLVVVDVAGVVVALLGAAPARVLRGDALAAEQSVLPDGDAESLEVAHQVVAPFCCVAARFRAATLSAAANSPEATIATAKLIPTTRAESIQSPSGEN